VTLLAPKADNRKGEFREIFDEARKAGFVRVRVDGVVRRLDEVTALDKKKKHTVQIVVDRVVLDHADKARLSDSIETALRAGGGTLLAAVEGEDRERAYSEERACPACGVGLPELSPQSFSFNSPLGMCVDCNGLGSTLEVDPDLVVPNGDLSIAEGAIEPWGERFAREEGWTTRIAAALEREMGIPLKKPWKQLTARQREIVLFGTGERACR
jgi:excinuclease ABC subunit A